MEVTRYGYSNEGATIIPKSESTYFKKSEA